MKPFFLAGCPRSGTTMLQQALHRHSRIVIPPETRFFVDLVGHTRRGQVHQLRQINDDLGIDVPVPARRIRDHRAARVLYEQIARRYLEQVGGSDVTYFGEKSPGHLLCLSRIRRVYPDAKVVVLYRDGRDVALSLTKVPWSSDDYYFNFALWLRYMRAQKRAEQLLGPDLLVVRYEDVVQRPEPELRRILAFLSLPYEPAVTEGRGSDHVMTAGERGWKSLAVGPIVSSRMGQWQRELTHEHLCRVERWGGPCLRSLGYELATDGNGRLPPTFFPQLCWRQLVWRARCAWELANRELWSGNAQSAWSGLRAGGADGGA